MSRVLVLGGGPDAERPVSLDSAAAVAKALQVAGHDVNLVTIDRLTTSELDSMQGEVIFPVLHGPWGEGGELQMVLEEDGRPFVGCRSHAARLAMDKIASKLFASTAKVPTAQACLARPGDHGCGLPTPLVIKPACEGSSVGLHLCHTDAQLLEALQSLDAKLGPWMAESMIKGRELTVGMIERDGRLVALPLVEIRPRGGSGGAYDYEAKYQRDDTIYAVNPQLVPGMAAVLSEQALRVANAMGVRHVARADFLLDEKGIGWFLEINTMPGFTSHSLLPLAAASIGLDMPRLTDTLVHAALRGVRLATAE
jgi:D-alanine-D-alanine ligase